ncbi:hypothetical protein [Arthrobacter sp. LjRoot14]
MRNLVFDPLTKPQPRHFGDIGDRIMHAIDTTCRHRSAGGGSGPV